MRKRKKSKRDIKIIHDPIHDLIFGQIESFFNMIKYDSPYLNYKIIINKIFNFIESDFPDTKSFQRIKGDFKSLLLDNGSLCYKRKETKISILSSLVDLASTYKKAYFDSLGVELHPKVKELSFNLFKDGHYSQAIFESIKELNNYVKKKANISDADLAGAMAKAFNERNPLIKLNKLQTQSEKNEQEGFRFLFQGAMKGIRNPIGHSTYEIDRNTALWYLSFLSLLFKKAEEGII